MNSMHSYIIYLEKQSINKTLEDAYVFIIIPLFKQ